MTGATQTRATKPLLLVAGALAGLTLFLLALDDGTTGSAGASREPEVPAVASVRECGSPRERAAERAHELERAAHAHWERVPFDEGEAPLAYLASDEAVRCYTLAEDREGRARSELLHIQLSRELELRVQRRRFWLAAAQRKGARERIVREAEALLSLYSRSGPEGRGYREHLLSLARRARAQALELSLGEEEATR